jgi:hypothetical protein
MPDENPNPENPNDSTSPSSVKVMRSRHGLLDGAWCGEPGSPLRERGGPILDRSFGVLEELLDATVAEAMKISKSRNFTGVGRASALEEVGTKALNKLADEAKLRRAKLDQALEQARKAVPDAVQAADVVNLDAAPFVQLDSAQRVAEARQQLRDADPSLRHGLTKQAAEAGDPHTIFAVESMTQGERVRLQLDLEDLRETYWRAVRPEAFACVQEIEAVIALVVSNIARAERLIEGATGVTALASKPIEFLDADVTVGASR